MTVNMFIIERLPIRIHSGQCKQVILDFQVSIVDGLLNGQVSTKAIFTVILFTFVNLIYTLYQQFSERILVCVKC